MNEKEVEILASQIDHPPLPPGEHGVFRLVLDYTSATGDLDAVTLQVAAKLTEASGPERAFEPNFEVIEEAEIPELSDSKKSPLKVNRRFLEV